MTLASMFVSNASPSPSPYRGQVSVVDGCSLTDASIAPDNKAYINSVHVELVRLDPETGRVVDGAARGGLKILIEHRLVLTGGDGKIPPAWKIEGTMRPPLMTLGAAVRYVTRLRDTTTSSRIRKIATQGLAWLKLQQRH
jgi:hypothetical protein